MKGYNYIKWAFLILFLVMFVLPFFSAEGYSIIKHTTSELGAQNTKNAWVMNFSFIVMGLACIIESNRYLKGFLMHRILLIVFGLSLIGAGIFGHTPINKEIAYSQTEDFYHSIASSVTGFTFTVFAISSAFILSNNKSRIIAIVVGIIAVGLSALMMYVTEYAGVWQRLIFIVSFTWLIYFFNNLEKVQKENSK